jgi:hypothetical protein
MMMELDQSLDRVVAHAAATDAVCMTTSEEIAALLMGCY